MRREGILIRKLRQMWLWVRKLAPKKTQAETQAGTGPPAHWLKRVSGRPMVRGSVEIAPPSSSREVNPEAAAVRPRHLAQPKTFPEKVVSKKNVTQEFAGTTLPTRKQEAKPSSEAEPKRIPLPEWPEFDGRPNGHTAQWPDLPKIRSAENARFEVGGPEGASRPPVDWGVEQDRERERLEFPYVVSDHWPDLPPESIPEIANAGALEDWLRKQRLDREQDGLLWSE